MLLVEEADKHGFVREFIEMGHPEAVHLRRILRLAEKTEDAGWSPNDPPPEVSCGDTMLNIKLARLS